MDSPASASHETMRLIAKEQPMKINLRRLSLDVVKALLFAMAVLYLADYFGWSLFTEAGGVPTEGLG